MKPFATTVFAAAVALWSSGEAQSQGNDAKQPNVVFIFTDDQDYHHSSLDYMQNLQKELVAKGTEFTNHYATISVCCPSRVSLMRGQLAHNTNNTHVRAPGGGYPKFLAAAEDDDYLPLWLTKAGYQAEYIGKLFNGNGLTNYNPAPKYWTHTDLLMEPYINRHDTVVMSENGARPKFYSNWQQTDVIRTKAIARLQTLVAQEDPFFLMVAPTAPHVHNATVPPIPAARHLDLFQNITVPRTPDWNPSDEYQQQKPAYIRTLPLLNQTQINEIDLLYQRRLQALQSVDELIQDVVDTLEEAGKLDDTYRYHLGSYRQGGGKSTPYLRDSNIPLVVRGPGIQAGVTSRTPSTVTDFAPTFLQIAGLSKEDWPSFLDGESLLASWESPNNTAIHKKKEAINVEFWGYAYNEIPSFVTGDGGKVGYFLENDYKTMRIVGDESAWLYSRWCTNDTELYDTKNDPYELTNLANSSDPQIQRVLSRLNALLLVTKSCTQETCRDPWSILQPTNLPSNATAIKTLDDALDPAYDSFYDAFPPVTISECLGLQVPSNEAPFYPDGAETGLGLAFRNNTDGFSFPDPLQPVTQITGYLGRWEPAGGWDQRHASLEALMADARELTDDEMTVTNI
ncbi:Arylsulfatase [Diaporthe amygdali]|uniref:Arylsulfatase n=1 Tax=Phomopsis amygdali TaxID=1214568 RepID=UPI0022FF102E|nr:Arylsulfatase [Diaporthe amygdali]KAJ0107029.1 Arylsulfatase [Diaporthe amygdali]